MHLTIVNLVAVEPGRLWKMSEMSSEFRWLGR